MVCFAMKEFVSNSLQNLDKIIENELIKSDSKHFRRKYNKKYGHHVPKYNQFKLWISGELHQYEGKICTSKCKIIHPVLPQAAPSQELVDLLPTLLQIFLTIMLGWLADWLLQDHS